MAPSAESSASGAAAASASAPAYKRRRVVEEEPDLMSYEDDDDTYEAYIPASKRKQMELQRIAGRGRVAVAAPGAGTAVETGADKGGDDDDMGVRQSKTALLHAARELKALQAKEQKSEAEKAAEEERKILDAHAARRLECASLEHARRLANCDSLARRAAQRPRPRAPGRGSLAHRRRGAAPGDQHGRRHAAP